MTASIGYTRIHPQDTIPDIVGRADEALYFAKENGLKQYAIEEEGREPSITQLKELIQRAKSEDINLIFVQKEFSNRNIQVFIDATHSKAVEINPLSYDWEGQMLLITKEIAQSGKK